MWKEVKCKSTDGYWITPTEKLLKIKDKFVAGQKLNFDEVIYLIENGLSDDNRILYNEKQQEIIVIDDVNKDLFSSINGTLDGLIEGIIYTIGE